jgi:hypothetical protein
MVFFPEIINHFLLLPRRVKFSKHLMFHDLIARTAWHEASQCTFLSIILCLSGVEIYFSAFCSQTLSFSPSERERYIIGRLVHYLFLNFLEYYNDCQASGYSCDASSFYGCDNRLTSLVDELA